MGWDRTAFFDHASAALAEWAVAERVSQGGWRGRRLRDEELDPFLAALDAGLARVEGADVVVDGFGGRPRRYALFMAYEGPVADPGRLASWTRRPTFVQIGFAAELVLDGGWPPECVALDVDHLDVTAGSTPLGALTEPSLAALAKLDDSVGVGLRGMEAAFFELNGTAGRAASSGARHNAIPSYRSLQRLRPRVLVSVAPGVRRPWQLRYDDDRVLFTSRSRVPRRPVDVRVTARGAVGWAPLSPAASTSSES